MSDIMRIATKKRDKYIEIFIIDKYKYTESYKLDDWWWENVSYNDYIYDKSFWRAKTGDNLNITKQREIYIERERVIHKGVRHREVVILSGIWMFEWWYTYKFTGYCY